MLTRSVAATGVFGLLTVVPGPDMAVVIRRAVVAGPGDALRAVGGIATGTSGACSWPSSRARPVGTASERHSRMPGRPPAASATDRHSVFTPGPARA